MVRDLVCSEVLIGLDRERVVELLGEPDDEDDLFLHYFVRRSPPALRYEGPPPPPPKKLVEDPGDARIIN